MANYKELEDYLLQDCQGKFKDKSWFFGLFGSMIYTPTGEKFAGGFRYFACGIGPVLEAFERKDIAALLKLPFALDDEGDADTSSVVVNLHYTPSGSALAMQVEQYQNSNPVPVSPVIFLEGTEASSLIAQVKELDQSN